MEVESVMCLRLGLESMFFRTDQCFKCYRLSFKYLKTLLPYFKIKLVEINGIGSAIMHHKFIIITYDIFHVRQSQFRTLPPSNAQYE